MVGTKQCYRTMSSVLNMEIAKIDAGTCLPRTHGDLTTSRAVVTGGLEPYVDMHLFPIIANIFRQYKTTLPTILSQRARKKMDRRHCRTVHRHYQLVVVNRMTIVHSQVGTGDNQPSVTWFAISLTDSICGNSSSNISWP